MRIITTIGAIVCVALLTPAVPAHASIITYEFDAQVSLVIDPASRLGGAVTTGTTFTGRYIFDSATADSNSNPGLGEYRQTVAPTGISMTLGGFTFTSDPANLNMTISIGNDRPVTGDTYLLRSVNNLPISQDLKTFGISLQLDNPAGTAFTSDALPLVPPNLALFTQFFGLTIEGGRIGGNEADPDFILRSTLTSLREVPTEDPNLPQVPEPGTLVMMLTGGVGLVSRLGRRRSRASATTESFRQSSHLRWPSLP